MLWYPLCQSRFRIAKGPKSPNFLRLKQDSLPAKAVSLLSQAGSTAANPFALVQVTGVTDVEHSDEAEKEEVAAADEAEDGEPGPEGMGVPEFWLRAMKNFDILEEQITAKDEGPLKFLVDIACTQLSGEDEDGEPERGFKLDFTFVENPYFSNAVLTKSYFMVDDTDPILERAEGTEIQWKAGKNVTVKVRPPWC